MLIYNTTYQTENDEARNFVVWMHEVYIPGAEAGGLLANPRFTRILSHKEESSECFSLQWEVADSRTLHQWHTHHGIALQEEMKRIFKDKVVGFSTLMEVIE